MSDTLPNIAITAGAWVDVYALTGIAVGTKLNVENTGTCDVYLAVQAAQPDPDHNDYNILKRTGPKMTNHAGDSGAWAFCGHSDGELNVSVKSFDGFSPVLPGTEFDAMIEISDRGTTALGVFVQDQTTPVLTVPFLQTRAPVTLAADAAAGDRAIDLVAGHGTLFGEVIEIAETGSSLFMQAEVVDPLGVAAPGTPVVGDTVTLDQPVNRAYTAAGATVLRSTKDMLVDGSVTSQVFSVLPLPSQAGDMVRILLEMRSTTPMDFTTFGGVPALTNGCVLRINHGDGTFTNLFNFKSNSDFFEQGFDHEFFINNGNNTRGFTARVTWGGQSKHGVVIRLDGELFEALEIVIQDDLETGANTRFHLTAQGHELQG